MYVPYVPVSLCIWLHKHVCPCLYIRNLVVACCVLLFRWAPESGCMRACPLLSIHRSSFRPGWSGVLAEEVGGELKPEAPGIGAKSIEEREEVLGAEDCVSQCKGQGRWDDAPAVLHHPCIWPPLHSCCLTRPVHHGLPWGTGSTHIRSLALPLLPPPYPIGCLRVRNRAGASGKEKALPHWPGRLSGRVRSQHSHS